MFHKICMNLRRVFLLSTCSAERRRHRVSFISRSPFLTFVVFPPVVQVFNACFLVFAATLRSYPKVLIRVHTIRIRVRLPTPKNAFCFFAPRSLRAELRDLMVEKRRLQDALAEERRNVPHRRRPYELQKKPWRVTACMVLEQHIFHRRCGGYRPRTSRSGYKDVSWYLAHSNSVRG